MPAWERRLLVRAGEQLLGLTDEEAAQGAPSELDIITTPGIG